MEETQNPIIPVIVRPATDEEVKVLLDWCAKLKMDMSVYDQNACKELDPGCILTAVNMTGELVAFGGLCIHSDDMAMVFNFIVREDLRKRGIGRQLWKALIDRAGGRNIALDSVPYMEHWYEKQGFVYKTYKIESLYIVITVDLKTRAMHAFDIQPLADHHWPVIMEYDRQVYPTLDRERKLRAWFCQRQVQAVVAFGKDGNIVGFGSIHSKPGKEFGLRNVFADSEDVAVAIVKELFANVPVGYAVRFIKLHDKPLPKYLEKAVKRQDTARRMYNKPCIETNTAKIWFPSIHTV